jgi:hypothetical protein
LFDCNRNFDIFLTSEDEEDLCPALETVETQIRAEKEEQRRQAQREEEARTQAVLDDFQGSEGLLREIAKAIQVTVIHKSVSGKNSE